MEAFLLDLDCDEPIIILVQQQKSLPDTLKTVRKLDLEFLLQLHESGPDDGWLLLLVRVNLVPKVVGFDVFGVILLVLAQIVVREEVLLKVIEIDSLRAFLE